MFFDFLRGYVRIIFIKNSSAELKLCSTWALPWNNCAQLCSIVLSCAQLCSILAQLGSIVLNWAQLSSIELNGTQLDSIVLNWPQLCSTVLNCAQPGSNIALLGISETMKNMNMKMKMNKSLFLKRIALRALKK